GRGLALLWVAAPRATAAYAGSLATSGLAPVLQAWLFKATIDGLMAGGGSVVFFAVLYGATIVVLDTLEPLAGLLIATLQKLAVAAIPHIWSERRSAALRYATLVQHSVAAREMDYCLQVTTEAAAAKEVRVFGLGAFFLERFRAHTRSALAQIDAVRLRQVRL